MLTLLRLTDFKLESFGSSKHTLSVPLNSDIASKELMVEPKFETQENNITDNVEKTYIPDIPPEQLKEIEHRRQEKKRQLEALYGNISNKKRPKTTY